MLYTFFLYVIRVEIWWLLGEHIENCALIVGFKCVMRSVSVWYTNHSAGLRAVLRGHLVNCHTEQNMHRLKN